MPYKDPEKRKEAAARSYQKNKERYKLKRQRSRDSMNKKVREIKEGSPCVDCKQYYPFWIMQFDHIDDNKIGSVSSLARSKSFNTVLAEIAKCELVCANCHATRTYNRLAPIG